MLDEEIAEMVADSVGLEEEAAPSEEKDPVEMADVEPDKAEAEQKEEDQEIEPESKSEAEGEPEPDKGKENGVQKRINELTFKRKEAERRAGELEAKVQELEGRKQVERENQKEPSIDDFTDYGDYETALVDFKVEEKLRVERHEDAVKNQQIKQQGVQNNFNERVEKANLDGYKEASKALMESRTLPPHLIGVLLEHEKGPELVHFLGSHLDVSDSLNNLRPEQALVKLGEISANLSNVKKTKKITEAPDPMTTIKTSGTKKKEFDDMDVGELVEMARAKKI